MPNRNSYLAVGFSDQARDWLHGLALSSLSAADRAGCGFDPMARDGLHVTFLFMAEALGGLSAEKLGQFHQAVVQAVEALPPGQLLRPEGLDLFPPGKSNLIVLKFAVSDPLRAMQLRVLQAAAALGIGGSQSERQRLYGDLVWVPHCTLGKLRGSAEVVAFGGREVIRQLQCPLRCVGATGLEMCGAVPRQKWIDWQNTLLFDEEAPADAEESELGLGAAEQALLVHSCVGSTTAIQAANLAGTALLKRSVSWYLGPGASARVEAVACVEEDDDYGDQ